MQEFLNKVNSIFKSIPDLIVGIIYLAVAFLVAWLVKSIIVKILDKVGLSKKLNGINKSGDSAKDVGTQTVGIIGKLAFLVVFVLFLPAALVKFGMTSITAPIVNLINTFIGYIPNVVACVVVLLIGFFVANIVRQLIVAAVGLTKIDKLQEKISKGKAGINIAKLLGNVVYVVIAIVVLICALSILNITAISVPATSMLNTVMNSIPLIIVALLVLFVGVVLGNMVESFILSILGAFNLDDKCNKWISDGSNKEIKPIGISKIITSIVKAVIVILFVVEAIDVLDFAILTVVGTAIIAFLPSVLVAVVFAVAAYIACRIIDAKLHIDCAPNAPKIVKAAVVVVAAFIVLSQLGVAPVIINTVFVVAIISCGIAFAIAGGIGGRQFIQDLLANVKIGKKDKENKD